MSDLPDSPKHDPNRNSSHDGVGAVLPRVTSASLIQYLDGQLDSRESLLAFDGDGTLWTGEVSDDVFLSACREGWLLDDARPALIKVAASHSIDASGSASQIALRLFEAVPEGRLDECTLFASMAWCYAGRSVRELTDYAAKVLSRESFPARLRPEIAPLLAWAREHSVHCIVVSASPTPIVKWAASHWGFAPENVIGTMPQTRNGVIADQLFDQVPFGTNKCTLLKTSFPNHRVLGSFGDSDFDFEMLQCAELAVAVSPKASLAQSLLRLRQAVVLNTQTLAR
jgi:phosphoserine phosphatase